MHFTIEHACPECIISSELCTSWSGLYGSIVHSGQELIVSTHHCHSPLEKMYGIAVFAITKLVQ